MSDSDSRSGTGAPPAEPRRVAFVSLGCPKNQVDGEVILGNIAAKGAEIVDDPDHADTIVVNTCAFIDRARDESIGALLDAAAWKEGAPGRRLIAAGCLVQRSGEELLAEIPEIDGAIGLDQLSESAARVARPTKRSLPSYSEPATAAPWDHAAPRVSLSPPWSAYVKIAEGCDQSCAFCAIPVFRGRMRSRTVDDLVAELALLAGRGVREANLVAQDSTGYGRDLGTKHGLAALVRAIDAADEAPEWVRLHYLYPGRIADRLLEELARATRIVEYVDLPLQHSEPEVLRRMGRPGSGESYLRQLESLKKALPGAGMRSGFIVGFPGETEEQFERLLEFVEEASFDAVGVFAYSHEDQTSAASFEDDVPEPVKIERKERLEELVSDVSHERNRARVGRELELLVERAEGSETIGRWRGQAPEVDGVVQIETEEPLTPGTLVRGVVTGAGPFELTATVASGESQP